MADPELEEIRRQRLAQMQAQFKGSDGDANAQKAKEEQARAQEDAKNSILSQIMDQQARARLNTLMLGKPEKGRMVENMLVQMAQTGRICQKIDEAKLIELLESLNAQTAKNQPTVKFDRRRAALDSDDDDI